ncbi:MAG: lysophospholipid acyltransferase family protein [Polyangiaceae bacterium]
MREVVRFNRATLTRARILGWIVGWLARAWLATLRVELVIDERIASEGDRPRVICFFHGTQFPLLAWRRRRPTAVMVSHSRDGELQSVALRVNGLRVVRGSSSRGGARALAALVRSMKRGIDTAFAVDGPRGPYGVVKSGAIVAAKSVGGQLVPIGSACARAWVFARAWDKFRLPLPFSRVAVVVGPPLEASASPDELAHAIVSVNDAATRIIEPIFGALALPPAK